MQKERRETERHTRTQAQEGLKQANTGGAVQRRSPPGPAASRACRRARAHFLSVLWPAVLPRRRRAAAYAPPPSFAARSLSPRFLMQRLCFPFLFLSPILCEFISSEAGLLNFWQSTESGALLCVFCKARRSSGGAERRRLASLATELERPSPTGYQATECA